MKSPKCRTMSVRCHQYLLPPRAIPSGSIVPCYIYIYIYIYIAVDDAAAADMTIDRNSHFSDRRDAD